MSLTVSASPQPTLAPVSSGLLYTSDGPTYNGQPITLAEIASDHSGRFSDRQKGQARNLRDMQAALGAIDAFEAARPKNASGMDGKRDTARRWGESSTLSLSSAAQRRLAGSVEGSDSASDDGPIAPKLSFSSQLQAAGFTVSASADTQQGSFSISITGPGGFAYSDMGNSHFGEGSVTSPSGSDVTSEVKGNEIYVTLTQSSASASTSDVETSSGAEVEASASAQSSTTTFVFDFITGALSVTQSAETVTLTATQTTAAAPSRGTTS